MFLGIFAVLTGVCIPARGQVIQTIAGGFNPSASPSENACVPLQSVAPHGTDVYIVSCAQIFKVNAQGQFTHVAGTGINAFSPDGTAASANFDNIGSLSLDSAGNIYFNEAFSNRVREIVASTGLIKTVAGTGTSGYDGDGGLATNAEISGGFRMGIFVDASGNVFIADQFNERVREVAAATGIITTVAGDGTAGFSGDGGPATSAELRDPRGVVVDGAGNIFIADANNNRIRKVTAATGSITTVAGNGTSGFAGDGGPATSAEIAFGVPSIALDASGNLFVADMNNSRIREVVAATGKIQTVAGNGAALLSGCSGGVNACIGVGGPATKALVPGPIQVAVDSSGNIYIATETEFRNMIDEVVASTGNLQVFAANGAQDFTGTNGPAVSAQLNVPNFAVTDSAGNVFIADANNNVIYEVVAATGILKIVAGTGVAGFSGDGGPATSAELANPFTVVVDGSGNLFIADNVNSVIREVVAATGFIQTVAGNASAACNFTLGDGGPATSASLCFPDFAALDSHGNIFIADTGYSLIREVNASTGVIQTVAGSGGGNGFGFSGDGGPATSALLNGPNGVFADSSGNFFIADQLNNVIREVNTAGTITTVAGNTSGTAGFSGDGGPAVGAELFFPGNVWGDSSGNFFVSDFNNEVIRKFTVGGNIQTVAGNRVIGVSGDGGPATSAELDGPDGVFVEPSGSLLIADIGNGRIRIVGQPTTTALATSANPSVVGKNVTIQATVSAPGEIPPVGSVTILDNGNLLATLGVSGGVPSTLVTNTLAVGYHLLTAQFFGTNFPGSVSSQLNQQVVNVGPNPPQGTPPTGPGALSSGAGSFNFGWPPGCDPTATSGPTVCAHSYGITYPPGMFGSGAIVTIIPTETTQAGWALRTPAGNPYFGTQLAEVTGFNGNGFIYSATCTPTADCPPANSPLVYSITTKWQSPDTAYCTEHPQLLKADPIGSDNWIGTLMECFPNDPVNKGRSPGTLSDWANVKGVTGTAPTITITSPVNGATYALNETVDAAYDCGPTGTLPLIAAACFGGPDLVNGSTIVPSGSAVDTSTTGTKTFEVAADVNSGPGFVPPKTVTYNVMAGNQASASPASVNFGSVPVGEFGFRFVELKNGGRTSLSMSRVKLTSLSGEDSDDFFEVSLCPRTLGEGESCYILVSFFADKDTVNSTQSAILTIADNGVGGSLLVPLTATVAKH